MHPVAGQRRHKDYYKQQDVLPKINKSDMAGMMEDIEKDLASCHCVMKEPLSYVMRKNIIVETNSDYPKYAMPDDKMITRM